MSCSIFAFGRSIWDLVDYETMIYSLFMPFWGGELTRERLWPGKVVDCIAASFFFFLEFWILFFSLEFFCLELLRDALYLFD